MSDKTPLQDLVVILPGILGSELQKDGRVTALLAEY